MPYDPSSLDWQQPQSQPRASVKRRIFDYLFRAPFRRIALTQEAVDVLTGSTGKVRLTQGLADVLTGSVGSVRDTQAPVEILIAPDLGRALDWVQPQSQPYPYRHVLTARHLEPVFGPVPLVAPQAASFATLTQAAVELFANPPQAGFALDWQQPQSQPYPYRRVLRAANYQFQFAQIGIPDHAKLSQEPTEVITGSSGKVRLTQESAEVFVSSTSRVRETQAPVEVFTASPGPGYALDWQQPINQPYPYRKRLSPAIQPTGELAQRSHPFALLTQLAIEVLIAPPPPGFEMGWVQPIVQQFPYPRVLPIAVGYPSHGNALKMNQMPIEIIVGYLYNPYVGWLGTSMSVMIG